jgi:hypothetical protein
VSYFDSSVLLTGGGFGFSFLFQLHHFNKQLTRARRLNFSFSACRALVPKTSPSEDRDHNQQSGEWERNQRVHLTQSLPMRVPNANDTPPAARIAEAMMKSIAWGLAPFRRASSGPKTTRSIPISLNDSALMSRTDCAIRRLLSIEV